MNIPGAHTTGDFLPVWKKSPAATERANEAQFNPPPQVSGQGYAVQSTEELSRGDSPSHVGETADGPRWTQVFPR